MVKILYWPKADDDAPPIAPPVGPNSDGFTLTDPLGKKWDVRVLDNGLLQTIGGSTNLSSTVFLDSQDKTTSWRIDVNTSGLLTTTAVALNTSYPTLRWMGSITGLSVWGLGVLNNGQLFDEQSPVAFDDCGMSFQVICSGYAVTS